MRRGGYGRRAIRIPAVPAGILPSRARRPTPSPTHRGDPRRRGGLLLGLPQLRIWGFCKLYKRCQRPTRGAPGNMIEIGSDLAPPTSVASSAMGSELLRAGPRLPDLPARELDAL